MDQVYPPEIERLRRYRTERREQKVTVTFEKSPLPMLWLDTSVLIDLAKIDTREAIEPGRVAPFDETAIDCPATYRWSEAHLSGVRPR